MENTEYKCDACGKSLKPEEIHYLEVNANTTGNQIMHLCSDDYTKVEGAIKSAVKGFKTANEKGVTEIQG